MLRGMTTQYTTAKETTQYPNSFSEIDRRGKSTCHNGNALACPTDKSFEFFITVHSIAVKYINPQNIGSFQGNIFGLAIKAVLSDEQLYTAWFNSVPQTNTSQSDDDHEMEITNAMALLEELVTSYISILLADGKKTFLEQKSRKKTTALRKGLKMLPTTEIQKPSTSAEVVVKRAPSKRRSKTVQYPCGKCGSECNADSIECSLCEIWFHYKCLNLSGDEYFIVNESIDFYCPECDIDEEVPTKSKVRKRKT